MTPSRHIWKGHSGLLAGKWGIHILPPPEIAQPQPRGAHARQGGCPEGLPGRGSGSPGKALGTERGPPLPPQGAPSSLAYLLTYPQVPPRPGHSQLAKSNHHPEQQLERRGKLRSAPGRLHLLPGIGGGAEIRPHLLTPAQ